MTTDALVDRLRAEAKIWPRSDISGLLNEAADALALPQPVAGKADSLCTSAEPAQIPAESMQVAPPVAFASVGIERWAMLVLNGKLYALLVTDGEYVKYSDHAAQLAAKDESIRVWTAAHGNAHRRAEAALGLLRVLAGAESAYRANPNSVVAWDRMREAGDKSRALLDALTGETPGRAGGVEVGGG